MRSQLFVPKRYQLKKQTTQIVKSGHPWVFRNHLSSAIEVFPNGQWLRLMDNQNHTIGYGIYEKEGLLGLRILKQSDKAPDALWIYNKVQKAIHRRAPLTEETECYRLIHGENDGFSGIIFDIYGSTGVLQTYSESMDSLGRHVAQIIRKELDLKSVVWKLPVKRKNKDKNPNAPKTRVLFGNPAPLVRTKEGKITLCTDVLSGQKSGAFLDLRGLRRKLSQNPSGKRVLNLFSYTGTLGLAAAIGGAKEVTNVDISQGALDFGKKNHQAPQTKFEWIKADVFKWLYELPKDKRFDTIIIDPPLMAANSKQVPRALKQYEKLYMKAIKHLRPKGLLIVGCCTSRIKRNQFQLNALNCLKRQAQLIGNIPPEIDHPAYFKEADYLKVLVFKKFA